METKVGGGNLFDDPYIILAHHILSSLMKSEVERVLVDDDFIRRLIIKETRNQDFSGAFLDCIVQSILDDKRRMEMCHELDKLSQYFFENLDLERLRKEVSKYGKKYKIL